MAVMEKNMVMRVKASAQAAVSWIQSNPISLFLFILAFAMGIAFIMYPHMMDWMSDECGACRTGPITFE
jgi:hypothetical protein